MQKLVAIEDIHEVLLSDLHHFADNIGDASGEGNCSGSDSHHEEIYGDANVPIIIRYDEVLKTFRKIEQYALHHHSDSVISKNCERKQNKS